jgi:hypothetical protein
MLFSLLGISSLQIQTLGGLFISMKQIKINVPTIHRMLCNLYFFNAKKDLEKTKEKDNKQ